MIQFSLKCSNDHRFDSWFQSASAFEKLQATKMVNCPVCGDTCINKAMMAPRVRPARNAATAPTASPEPATPLSEPASAAEQVLRDLKKEIEKTSDYVGEDFASEARAMHAGDAPERSIYGEAKSEDAKSLIEEGIPVTPLPFLPGRKSN